MTTTNGRRHPLEDDLILHYYDEAEARWVGEHLDGCATCRDEMERLRRTLDLAELPGGDGPDELTIERIRRGVARGIGRRDASGPAVSRGRAWWATAAAAAVLAVVAFLAGRMAGPVGEPVAADVRERARLLAVADHLERSRRAVAELVNATAIGESAADDAFRRVRATELAAFNRLHRQFAAGAGDDVTAALLEDLERILLDAANADELDAATVLQLQRRVARTDLLYRMRLTEESARERAAPPAAPRSANEA